MYTVAAYMYIASYMYANLMYAHMVTEVIMHQSIPAKSHPPPPPPGDCKAFAHIVSPGGQGH